jgi:diguanylate cyclase (GGDEF)-like protein
MVLQSLADLLRNFFRTTDICCRYGGEEFAIILPESSSRDAALRADALRAEVKALRLQYKKQTLGQLTLSVGVAAFPEHGSASRDLLKIADQSLYESKARLFRKTCDLFVDLDDLNRKQLLQPPASPAPAHLMSSATSSHALQEVRSSRHLRTIFGR